MPQRSATASSRHQPMNPTRQPTTPPPAMRATQAARLIFPVTTSQPMRATRRPNLPLYFSWSLVIAESCNRTAELAQDHKFACGCLQPSDRVRSIAVDKRLPIQNRLRFWRRAAGGRAVAPDHTVRPVDCDMTGSNQCTPCRPPPRLPMKPPTSASFHSARMIRISRSARPRNNQSRVSPSSHWSCCPAPSPHARGRPDWAPWHWRHT